jgi:hypothetical protein
VARKILRDRFPAGEAAIYSSPQDAFDYVMDVVREPDEVFERVLARDGANAEHILTYVSLFRPREAESEVWWLEHEDLRNNLLTGGKPEVLIKMLYNWKFTPPSFFHQIVDDIKDGTPERWTSLGVTSVQELFRARLIVLESILHNRRATADHEAVVARISSEALTYAHEVIRGRWRPGEAALARDSEKAVLYCLYCLRRQRFHAAEPTIARSALHSFMYAQKVVGGKWPDGHAAIASDSDTAWAYAQWLQEPFPDGEAAIKENPHHWRAYEAMLDALLVA